MSVDAFFSKEVHRSSNAPHGTLPYFSHLRNAGCVRHVSIDGAPYTLNCALPIAKEMVLTHASTLAEDDPQLRVLRLGIELRDLKTSPFRSIEAGVLARPVREPMLASESMRARVVEAESGNCICRRFFDVNYDNDDTIEDEDAELMRAFYVPRVGLLQVRVPGTFLLFHRARASSKPYTIVRYRQTTNAPPPKDPRNPTSLRASDFVWVKRVKAALASGNEDDMYDDAHDDPVNSWLWWCERGDRERMHLVYWDRDRLRLHLGLVTTTASGRSMASPRTTYVRMELTFAPLSCFELPEK